MSAIAMVSRFIMIEPKYSKSGPAIFIQQHLRLLQIARVEPLRKPPVNRSEQFASLLRLALVAPEARKAYCGAEFPELCRAFAGRIPDATRRENHEFLKSIYVGRGPQINAFSKSYSAAKSTMCSIAWMGNTEEHGNASGKGPAVLFWPAMVRP